jgi:N-acyl-D-aspartate/D-glutamate deacylase
VTWTKLLANKEAERHKTSKKELDNMRALIARDLADAGLAGLSADRRFATAYNAALQAANMAIACAGYRVSKCQLEASALVRQLYSPFVRYSDCTAIVLLFIRYCATLWSVKGALPWQY